VSAKSYLGGKVIVHGGDCLDVIKGLPDSSVDSCVTDPPYALTNRTPDVKWCVDCNRVLGGREGKPVVCPKCGGALEYQRSSGGRGFMGKQWDTGDRAFSVELWAEVFRVLKPGGHVLAFGGTRTVHRLACAIEDAGFDIRDQIMWVFGSGFPKSHDVAKGIDKAAGARGTYGEPKSAAHAGWIERGRMRGEDGHEGYQRPWMKDEQAVSNAARKYEAGSDAAREWQGWGTALKPAVEPIVLARKPLSEGTVAANVLRHGTGAINVDGCRVGIDDVAEPSRLQRQQSNRVTWEGGETSGFKADHVQPLYSAKGRWPANLIHDGSDEVVAAFPETKAPGRFPKNTGGIGTASGIYGKADGRDQIERSVDDGSGSAARFFYSAKADKDDRLGSAHPTIKPVDLMQYLVRLITPLNGICLDPFAGTGTTGEAAFREGMRAILIEREPEYLADIHRRMELVLSGPVERRQSSIKARVKTEHAGPLFALPEAAE
jgi:DNA modification methylase